MHPDQQYGPLPDIGSLRRDGLTRDMIDNIIVSYRDRFLWTPGRKTEHPSRMPCNIHQHVENPEGLQHQSLSHLQVSGLLAGFSLAGVGQEAAMGSRPDSIAFHILILDQAIMTMLCIATVVFLKTVLMCLAIDSSLTSKAGKRYHNAWGPLLGHTCWEFTTGTLALVLTMPLWVLRRFGARSPAVYLVGLMAVYFIYFLFRVFNCNVWGLNALLQHADLGIALSPDEAASLPLGKQFTDEGWEILMETTLAQSDIVPI